MDYINVLTKIKEKAEKHAQDEDSYDWYGVFLLCTMAMGNSATKADIVWAQEKAKELELV